MSPAGSLCRDPDTLVKRKKKNQLCDYNRASPVSWNPSIVMLGSRVETFQVITLCRAARRMNQARNRTARNTLFMRIASPAHVIRPLL